MSWFLFLDYVIEFKSLNSMDYTRVNKTWFWRNVCFGVKTFVLFLMFHVKSRDIVNQGNG